MKKLNLETITFLEDFDLGAKYSKLVETYPVVNPLNDYEELSVISCIKNNGYDDVIFYKSENYFLIEETPETILKLSVENGLVEFIMTMDNGLISFAGNLGFIVYHYCNKPMFKKPSFDSYSELSEILHMGFNIYRQMKTKLNDELDK